MIVMGNDSPYKIQQVIKNWEQTHEENKKTYFVCESSQNSRPSQSGQEAEANCPHDEG